MKKKQILLVEYFTTEESILIFGVRADWDEPRIVEIHRPLDLIRQFAARSFSLDVEEENIRSTGSKVKQLDENEWFNTMSSLVEPIAQWSQPDDYVYLIPHDVLHYLPLHALKVEGEFLIERNPIVYTPSASVLKYCQQSRRTSGTNLFIVGDSAPELPLPYATEEVRNIAKLYNVEPILGQYAKKSHILHTLEQQAQSIDILHFACHGYFHRTQPLNSGLIMADEEVMDSDGSMLFNYPAYRILTATDFFNLPRLKASLVTMSACDTGVSDIKAGDELFGLVRALIYAGAPSILMSLWSVNDVSTAFLMSYFYQQLRAGKAKIEALQSAKLYIQKLTVANLIKHYRDKKDELALDAVTEIDEASSQQMRFEGLQEKYGGQHCPFSSIAYWAAFVLIGDWY